MAEALPEVREQGFIALLDHVYQTGETYFGVEQPFVVPATADQPARLSYFTFVYQAYRENGQIAGISVFALEVTEQVRARQQREAQQAELQRIFEQAPAAIAILRGAGLVIELANEAMQAHLGAAGGPGTGPALLRGAAPKTTGQGFEQILADVLRRGQPFFRDRSPGAAAPARPRRRAAGLRQLRVSALVRRRAAPHRHPGHGH